MSKGGDNREQRAHIRQAARDGKSAGEAGVSTGAQRQVGRRPGAGTPGPARREGQDLTGSATRRALVPQETWRLADTAQRRRGLCPSAAYTAATSIRLPPAVLTGRATPPGSPLARPR
jgi:hypothetical protein